LIEHARFEEELIRTGSGDMLLMYTDGLVEATNRVEEMFGMRCLLDAVKGLHLASPPDAIREIIGKSEGFAGGTPLADDTTILAVRID
jgi:sigma-B regulation protein RsbU (phosphoserine phosphatase)